MKNPFNSKCLWHNWKYKDTYYDCSTICMWSNGTVKYRKCKDCNYQESSSHFGKIEWKIDDTKGIFNEI